MSLITIQNSFIGSAKWGLASVCNFNVDGQVDIWQIDVKKYLQHTPRFLAVLNKAEITRANKYISPADGERFIISRGSLRYILSRYLQLPPADIIFDLMPHKKPYLANQSKVHFNLSDSADKILIAIGAQPVGIDIEYIKPHFIYADILYHYFNPQEISFIKQHDNLQRFFLLWTRKEAVLKGTGIGLTDHLKRIPSLDGTFEMHGDMLDTRANWQLNSFNVDEDHIATIATSPTLQNFSFWNMDISLI